MSFLSDYQQHLQATIQKLDLNAVQQAADWLKEVRDRDGQIFVCGNGGSASTASHFATDLVKGASWNRKKRFRIQALTDSLSTITAYANDVGYDVIFAETLKNFARSGDLVICISGSGNSPNVLRAAETAQALGCRLVTLTGRDGGRLAGMGHLNILAADPHMGRIEDVHLIVCHMLAYSFMDMEPAGE